MAGVGSACLAVALLTALYAVVASVYGARSGRREWITSGRRAIYCVAALCVVAFAAARDRAFLRSDFSFALVAEGSSTDTPTFYKVTALWATQDGSLLLWATLLSLFASTVLFLTRRSLRDIAPYATAVLGCHRRLLPAADGGLGEPVRHARRRRRPRAPGSTRCCAIRR